MAMQKYSVPVTFETDAASCESARAKVLTYVDAFPQAFVGMPKPVETQNPKLTECAPALLAAVKAMLPWLGKLIADGGHLHSVLPGAAVRTMDVAQALVDRIEAPDPVFEPLIAQADYMDQRRAARRAKK